MDHTALLAVLGDLGLWLAFIAGQFLYILKCAGFAMRNKANPLSSRWQYVRLYWDILLYRGAVGALLFWLAVSYPEYITKGLSYLPGVPSWAANLHIPKIWPAFVAGGLLVDFALDWLSVVLATKWPKVFGKFLPKVPDDSPDGGK